MEAEAQNLFLAVFFSAAGFGYFIYGIRQRAGPALLVGFLLMIYPYFISGAPGLIGIGLLLMAVPFLTRRLGW